MGTPEFAVPSLLALAEKHEVLVAYTQPDRPAGRGRLIVPSPVKRTALDLGLSVRQPPTLRDESETEFLEELAPDVICVAAYGLILPRLVLDIPRLGCVNVHASLLPRYRGAAPVHHAILDGQQATGISIMRMEEGLDTGPYAAQVIVPVAEASVEELTATLAQIGAHALIEVLDAMEAGSVTWTVQDEGEASYAAKITRDDVALDPSLTVTDALRRIRASTRSSSSRVCVEGRNLTVLAAQESDVAAAPGDVTLDSGQLAIGLADGSLVLTEVRPEGRSAMEGSCFARGARLDTECSWGRCT